MILEAIKNGLKKVSDFVVNGIKKGYEALKKKSVTIAKFTYKYFVLAKLEVEYLCKGIVAGLQAGYEEWQYMKEEGVLSDEDEDELYDDEDVVLDDIIKGTV